jgi:hypothetical protein
VQKQSGEEMTEGPKQPAINEFILSSLEAVGREVKAINKVDRDENAFLQAECFFRSMVRDE